MMEKWEGKIAIVTGTSSGIGRAIAVRLVEAGVKVVGLARREERGRELAAYLNGKKGEFHHITADVTKEEDVLKAYRWIEANLEPVHILVNNAGNVKEGGLLDTDSSVLREVFEVNTLSVCMMTKEAVNMMRAHGIDDGHIVHINSVGGHVILNNVNVYSASKHAVTVLTETLRRELNAMGSQIKISSVSPGVVDTEVYDNTVELKGMVEKMTTLKAEDVVDTVIFILSRPPHVQIHDIFVRPVNQPF
uniref:Dehydrogenase n=1 Tax=Photinus pyralis TaxID=7054 RepID=A0A1Y1JWN6_PHOPY